ncbi:putative glucose-6-phosphate 1-epimerase isoform X2 [Quercus lobata]|uniref:putative glucose-6-phosphate 1-epimerase isoform X2 n=1 Tax=Quercus lobata TaxID=97700 RepID=UPI0012480403|nr:putative glucose-6-phosphate 1-epimerase isoform X2 [Quercus lobata]
MGFRQNHLTVGKTIRYARLFLSKISIMQKQHVDSLVWNPWDKKSKSMVDFGDKEYKQMLCVDGAAIEKPITLKPEEEWTGRLQLSIVPSSFCSEYLNL